MSPDPTPRRRNRPARSLSVALAAVMSILIGATPPAPVMAQQQRSISMITDTEIESIIRDWSTPVWQAAGLEPANVNLMLVGDRELNAFVAGGQNIFLNTGLILETKSPSQLLGVVAHETGHIALAHLARAREGTRSAVATMLLTMGLGLVAAMAAPDPRAGVGLLYSAEYFATLQLFTYTRVQESTADQAAAQYLEGAGYSGKGLVEFFNNFRFQEVFSEARRDAYFRSHPISSDRIKNLDTRVRRASNYEVTDTPEALEQHAVMIAKLRGFMNYPQQTYQDYPDTDQSYPARYARAIAYYKDLDVTKALGAVEDLLAEQPENPYLWELKGQILFENGRIAEAEAPQRRAVEIMPNAPLLRISLAQTLVATNAPDKAAEAVPILQRALTIDEDQPLGWRVLAEAYQKTNQPGLARLATAEQNFMLGQMSVAREFGMRAIELLETGTPEYRRASDIVRAAENIVLSRSRGG